MSYIVAGLTPGPYNFVMQQFSALSNSRLPTIAVLSPVRTYFRPGSRARSVAAALIFEVFAALVSGVSLQPNVDI